MDEPHFLDLVHVHVEVGASFSHESHYVAVFGKAQVLEHGVDLSGGPVVGQHQDHLGKPRLTFLKYLAYHSGLLNVG